mmetsp:Transcript_17830/g.32303  ORF Transcript_17830/g.32303 Transcript_17830/m.32303 type:complete len:208 (-) Transcript_17830:148-771(-)
MSSDLMLPAFVPGGPLAQSPSFAHRAIRGQPARLQAENVLSRHVLRMGVMVQAVAVASLSLAGLQRSRRGRVHRQAVETAEAPAQAKAKPAAKPKAKAKARPKKEPPSLDKQITVGPWAPLVIAGYAVFGEPFVSKARAKGIALHSRAITSFCERFGIGNKRRQGFIKTAKSTGHDLGMLVPGGQFGDGMLGPQALAAWTAAGADRW